MTTCYAAELGNCGGGMTREHFVSECLLERLGSQFTVIGLPWSNGPIQLSPPRLQSRMLCSRHNEALSPLDAEALKLFNTLEAVQLDREVDACSISGDHLERWAIKLLVGMLASGNVSRSDGVRVKDVPAAERLTADARRHYLRVLFGQSEMPDGGGFYLFLSPRPRLENQLEIILNSQPPGHPEQGLICAVTVQMLGLYFTTAFTVLRSEHETLWYRPLGLDLDGRARIDLRWAHQSSNEFVELRRSKTPVV